MAEDEPVELTPEELRAFEVLPREASPPPELERRVVAGLRARGLLRARRQALPGGGRVAIAAGLFAAGLAVGLLAGRTRASPPAGRGSGSLYMLLLYEAPAARLRAPDQQAASVREHQEWAASLRRNGSLVNAEKLASAARVLGAPDVPVSPPLGFFLVRAEGPQAALAIARSCPHARHGGTVVLQAIDPT